MHTTQDRDVDLKSDDICHTYDVPPRTWRWLMRTDIDWQSFRTCPPKVSCRSYLIPIKIWWKLQKIILSSIVMLCCHVTSALFMQMKFVTHLDVLWVNFVLAIHAPTSSTSGCNDAMIMSSLRALRAIDRSSAYELTMVSSLNSVRRSSM